MRRLQCSDTNAILMMCINVNIIYLVDMGFQMQIYVSNTGPYLGFFVCGGKLGFREISDQYSYKKQPSKIRHYVRKKTFSFPGGGNCPLRPPAMYGPDVLSAVHIMLLPSQKPSSLHSLLKFIYVTTPLSYVILLWCTPS